MMANDVCVSVQKGERGGKAADLKIHVVKSLTPTASFSSLTSALSYSSLFVLLLTFFKGGLSVFEFGGFMN